MSNSVKCCLWMIMVRTAGCTFRSDGRQITLSFEFRLPAVFEARFLSSGQEQAIVSINGHEYGFLIHRNRPEHRLGLWR